MEGDGTKLEVCSTISGFLWQQVQPKITHRFIKPIFTRRVRPCSKQTLHQLAPLQKKMWHDIWHLTPDTKTWKNNFFLQNILPEKCVNYNKSNLRQNSVNGPKDLKFQDVSKNATKKHKIETVLTFSTKQRKILQRCWHIGMIFSIPADTWHVSQDTWHLTCNILIIALPTCDGCDKF